MGDYARVAAMIDKIKAENMALREVVDFVRAALDEIENPLIRMHLCALIASVTETAEAE